MRHALLFAATIVTLMVSSYAVRAETVNCTPIIALPAVITMQGIHCFTQDLATPMTSGNAITIAAHNVTIDMNGFKLGGLGAGPDTLTRGIFSQGRQNITIRNGTIRGYHTNVSLTGDASTSSGHLVEDIRSEGARAIGISLIGSNSIIRDNFVIATGNGISNTAYGIAAQSGSGLSVIDNIVIGVTESDDAYGILASGPRTIVQDNQIRDVSASESGGIFSSTNGVIIRGNVISNESIGTTGIEAAGANDACVDNLVTNFTTALSGCGYSNGNRSF